MTSVVSEAIYKGSVKDIYVASGSDDLLFHFSDDFSVFDWGKMPDQIESKGLALTIIAAYFFEKFSEPEFWQTLKSSSHLKRFDSQYLASVFAGQVYGQLSQSGLTSHYVALSGDKDFKVGEYQSNHKNPIKLKVRRATVNRPVEKQIGNAPVYFYDQPRRDGLTFIPLEIVFRFGAPAGSSILSRLARDPNYAALLGLKRTDYKAGDFFERPVIEFFTKLESSDRLLSYQEAALTAALDQDEFANLYAVSELIALALYHVFMERGIQLFDGKVESAVERSQGKSKIVLVDSIGPDELRLDYQGIQLSKEILRDFYRQTSWYQDITASKAQAESEPGSKWQTICRNKLKSAPPPLSANLKDGVSKMYLALASSLIGKDLPGAVSLAQVRDLLKA